ncbi:murein L,D-transpeptidase catalytic domain-containing protein [Flavobacterium rhizosphaerae]|uniref:Murein L,D-transpeptidase catalytic domain-containing protein n=1 Tax=Flavobacterium rhizosphaerae TaxID=3163298 RepID=A0ABW8YSQ0_9FLAO
MLRVFVLLVTSLISCAQKSNDKPGLTAKDYTVTHTEALVYCKEHGFNQEYYFLLDFSIHSGKTRFFIYNFKEEKITGRSLVTHGSCDVPDNYSDKWQKPRFSNTQNSHCSAIGKYKIGNRDYSSWGIHVKYWLHGLEDTNSNAVKRVIVLHSWSAVSDYEVYPQYSPLSWGCPAVSDNFMKELDAKLQQTTKPVLLWIIE